MAFAQGLLLRARLCPDGDASPSQQHERPVDAPAAGHKPAHLLLLPAGVNDKGTAAVPLRHMIVRPQLTIASCVDPTVVHHEPEQECSCS